MNVGGWGARKLSIRVLPAFSPVARVRMRVEGVKLQCGGEGAGMAGGKRSVSSPAPSYWFTCNKACIPLLTACIPLLTICIPVLKAYIPVLKAPASQLLNTIYQFLSTLL